jgi:hypothetical protein
MGLRCRSPAVFYHCIRFALRRQEVVGTIRGGVTGTGGYGDVHAGIHTYTLTPPDLPRALGDKARLWTARLLAFGLLCVCQILYCSGFAEVHGFEPARDSQERQTAAVAAHRGRLPEDDDDCLHSHRRQLRARNRCGGCCVRHRLRPGVRRCDRRSGRGASPDQSGERRVLAPKQVVSLWLLCIACPSILPS